ncbi:3-hydroxyacyl-CoA dehydrogenase NAD-binding domain-containing protein [Ponticaulis sp.]|uniref:3-hydroxyacyl-CoA dehydrogenase NAD-binding domain-containing protein n=1 Tax=Ponticaulis sp. TaxID=2020902 RepID=UPI000B627813|nr:3-hydroxyacyl-CoA dehydrogenase NAD-binding domain-containing protein [Ponticaulis sp.]MAI90199.1 3-hydroxyacyl-CoA dehydrogenase [Ponticaulis sp.]OUX99846.1 MAG: 3-hydroxyacyl-CoA dehydrogenase [Hyphomonadaceae bacterium TMED5]|tara:strand:- start:166687 stop:168915 length:2229 start_codon:yes stop_codon:yes gene_type:complete
MNLETFSFEIDADGIALATFDVPGRSMNTLTGQVIKDIVALTNEVSSNDAIKGLVITSGKPSGFCAGADLGEMNETAGGGAGGDLDEQAKLKSAFDRAFVLNKTFRQLETCGKPVAAAINGLALGGGLELALACHYRVAANDNPKLQLGLPEAKIGLLPGAGGTQRLPRLIGLMEASQYILEGKSMRLDKAAQLGVVNETAPTSELVDRAKAWVKANPDAKAPWDEKKFKFPGGIPNQHPGASQIATMGNAMIAAKTYGNYPAQVNILKCLYEGSQVPMDAALRIETRYFLDTQQRPEAKGMIRSLFLSMQELSKGASRPAAPAKYEVKKAAVLGAGLMGAGIAHVQAMAGIETVLLDISQESAEKGKAYSKRILDKQVSRGKMTQEKADAVLANITPSTDYSLIKGADIVVEAVFEDTELKAKVTKMAEEHLSDTAVMGSNTSTLPITGLAEASVRPENYIGVHFFSPVERMGLVEIILGDKTTEETLAKTIDYVLKIRKTPIVVNDFRGFYTSRCFGTYTQEGMEMVIEGIKPAMIENIGRQAGMPMGPLEVSDSVGLDTALKIGRQYAKAAGQDANEDPRSQFLAWLVEDKGRLGRKAGKGYYEYGEDGKPTRLWPELNARMEVKVDDCPPELKEELTKRLLFRQCIEVARCFEEGVITDARDADIGSILAWGFAPYTGGCASYMDLKWGIPAFVKEADRLADAYGERFRPPQMLRDMAEKGESLYSRFPPAKQEKAAA